MLPFFAADLKDDRPVHPQRDDRGPARGGRSDELHIIPAKMVGPALPAGMEQRRRSTGLGIGCRALGLLEQRARNAGQGEILKNRQASGGPGFDVIDMKSRFLRDLRKAAIFAATTGSLDHNPAESQRDGGQPSSFRQASAFRLQPEQGKPFRERDQSLGFPSFGFTEPSPLILPVEKLLEPEIDSGWKTELLHSFGQRELDRDESCHRPRSRPARSRETPRSVHRVQLPQHLAYARIATA